jgi:hypothetical protein
MTIQANKIIKYILVLALAAMIAVLGYYFSGKQKLFTGNILGDIANPNVFNQVEFSDPIGVAYPVGNVVSIEQVLVDFKNCSSLTTYGSTVCLSVPGCSWVSLACTGTSEDGYATGDDILGSLVYFKVSPAANCSAYTGPTLSQCPTDQGCVLGSTCTPVADTGANVVGSQIDVSDVDYEVKVDIYATGIVPKLNTQSLIISQPDCSDLQTTLMKGQGTGMSGGGTLPTAATSAPFKFDQFSSEGDGSTANIHFEDFFTAIHTLDSTGCPDCKLVIENPTATGTTLGSNKFTLNFKFDSALPSGYIFTDPGVCNMSDMNDDRYCNISIKKEATVSATVAHFTDAINAISFRAFNASAGVPSTVVNLHAVEFGTHTNNYIYTATMKNTTTAYCNFFDSPITCSGLPQDTCTSVGCTWSGSACSGTASLACGTELKQVCKKSGDCKTRCELHSESQCLADANCTYSTICAVKDPIIQAGLTAFSGGENPGYAPIESIILSYTDTTVSGAQNFNINVSLDPDLSTPATVETLSEGNFEITIKDEGMDDTAGTAANFAYAFNGAMGASSPFVASINPTNSSWILLTTKELGTHTNNYICNIDGTAFTHPSNTTGKCFYGGAVGTIDVLTTPLVLDNEMNQGDTALVYAAGGLGDLEWKSTNPSILEVALFDEIDEGATGAGTAELLPQTLTSTYTVYPILGSYTFEDSDCTEVTDPDTDEILEQTCSFEVSNLLVKYDAPADGTAIVLVDGDTYNIPVQFGKMSGYLSGTGIWTYKQGIVSMTLEGTVTGTVTGSAPSSMEAEGMVYGTVKSDVTLNTSIEDLTHYASGAQIKATLISHLASLVPVASEIQPQETLSSSIMKVETVITDTAVLYAKRPGTSILTVTDSQHCSASVSVEIIGQKVILEMQDRDPSEVFEVGDPGVQIKAYRGTAEGEILEDITTKPQLEWASSNQEVATVDGTGILTVHSPGMTNITATYSSSEAEIGEINSNILAVRVNKITGMTIALNKATQALMPVEEKNQGYVNCALAINDPDAEGTSINIEGQSITIAYPTSGGPFEGDVEKVGALAGKIKSQILAVLDSVDVTQSTTNPGVLVLSANDNNTNGIVDISYSGNEQNVTILPFFPSNINLPATETYSLMVLAEYQDGKTKLISPTSLTWINTPVNYLDTALLPAGMLKLGETAGQSTVIARYVSVDVPPVNIDSNEIHVNVQSGPVIEYLHRIGVGAIQKGSELQFEMLISDIDTIADIDSLNVKLTSASNPALIFESVEYGDLYEPPADSGGEGEGEAEGEGEPVSTAPYYRIYTFTVTIPDNSLLANGNYILSITATDTSAHSSKVDKPIYIGAVTPGDVAGGGSVNFLDVYRAFQISTQMAAGTYTPTVEELEAADMDKDSDIDLMDVVAIFQLATTQS